MPPLVLLTALGNLQSEHLLGEEAMMNEFLRKMLNDKPGMAKASPAGPGFIHQGFEQDQLFKASYEHSGGGDCRDCDPNEKVQRGARDSTTASSRLGTRLSRMLLSGTGSLSTPGGDASVSRWKRLG